MNQSKLIIGGAAATLLLLLAYGVHHIATSPTGVAADDAIEPVQEPEQTTLRETDQPFEIQVSGYAWRVTPKARYRIAARVLHTERYRLGWQSTLSPLDLALGWAKLSDPKVDEHLSWSQSGRWYHWRWSPSSPYRNDYIEPHSANVHIVPANANVERAVIRLSADDVVLLEGLLVWIEGGKGSARYYWKSSLTRKDRGNNSCELLYLERLVVNGKSYQ